MKVLDLFSGIGGFSLGLERAGMTTVAFCEIEPFCQHILAKHWPGVPIFDDIRNLRGADLGSIDLICGGFPCQDISVAGKGAGLAGERSGLWREYARLIGEIRPAWVVIENVVALRSRGLDQILGEIATLGYDAEWHCIPAAAIGAPHRRDRVWIVAYASRFDVLGRGGERGGPGAAGTRGFAGGPSEHAFDVAYPQRAERGQGIAVGRGDNGGHGQDIGGAKNSNRTGTCGSPLADADRDRQLEPPRRIETFGGWAGDGGSGLLPEGRRLADAGGARLPGAEQPEWGQSIVTPADLRRAASERSWGRSVTGMGRTPDGISAGMDTSRPVEAWEGETPRTVGRGSVNRRPRLKALGNSVVPQVVELIGRAVMRRHYA